MTILWSSLIFITFGEPKGHDNLGQDIRLRSQAGSSGLIEAGAEAPYFLARNGPAKAVP
jgi:hypothetical protein